MDFYTNNANKNPYNSDGTIIYGEPDLRKEIAEILHNEKRGQYLIYRRVRRDSNGNAILAPSTMTNRSAEATFGTNKGMKYLFDDHLVVGYISEGSTFHETGSVKSYGDSRVDKNVLFLEYDVIYKMTNRLNDIPHTDDKILVPELDINGNLVSPLKCWMRYDLGSPEPYRLDGRGRVEFFKINLISNMDDGVQL
jgi:hypothetical protein